MGLSAKELTNIKETLATGKKPRVMFTASAGQIAGQIGHVVQLDDPAVQEDWILVKFGADVLPFPAADLAIAPRGAAAKKADAPPARQPELRVVREKARPIATPKPAASRPAVAPVTPKPAASKPAASKPAAPKPAKPKPLPSFTVTVSYTEGEWTVGAVQGAKILAKPYVIKPSEALKMVSILDAPGVHEAVEHILAGERAQARAHAEKLRTELADLEAKLAELGA